MTEIVSATGILLYRFGEQRSWRRREKLDYNGLIEERAQEYYDDKVSGGQNDF